MKTVRPSPLGGGKASDVSVGIVSPALATTALSSEVSLPIPTTQMHSGADTTLSNPFRIFAPKDATGPTDTHTPSPAGSLSEGMLNTIHSQSQERKRTTSTGIGGRPNPFRAFATTFGLPFSIGNTNNARERKPSTSSLTSRLVRSPVANASQTDDNGSVSGVGEEGQIAVTGSVSRSGSVRAKGASELLRKLDQGA